MVHRLDTEELRRALAQELPGDSAKEVFAVETSLRSPKAKEEARAASVLALLVSDGRDLRLPLIHRKVVEGDVHSGQISLPGGRQEPGEDAVTAALRETREELGIDSARIEVLGCLSPHRIPVSSHVVTPYVGWASGPLAYWRDPREVEGIFEVSLRELLDPHRRTRVPLDLRGERVLVPGWQLDEGLVWGATAMILAELLSLLSRHDSQRFPPL